MRSLNKMIIPLFLAGSVTATSAWAVDVDYDVTITNLTRGQVFTPILVTTHNTGIKAFTVGAPAIPELVEIAESGNTGPALSALSTLDGVKDSKDSGGVLPPGQSVTVTITGDEAHAYLTVISMLIPTNDAFMALNGKLLPVDDKPVVYRVVAYDAGSEENDELCASIPGPPSVCTGEGVSVADGEGYVHVHPGIHGIADLGAAMYDWRNPVAQISITRSGG